MFIAVERHGSVRFAPKENYSNAVLKPLVNAFVDTEAHLTSDEHSSYGRIGQDYQSHDHFNHNRGEYARGNVHSNTAESYAAILERAKQGVFHYMSKQHLKRYLDEFGFRWNHREAREHVTRKGVKKVTMVALPVLHMLKALLPRCAGKQLRWTPNRSVRSLKPCALA